MHTDGQSPPFSAGVVTSVVQSFFATIALESGDGILMARKKKLKRFRAVTAVKELARERVGSPPSEKIVIEKKKKPEKYKPTLEKLLEPE